MTAIMPPKGHQEPSTTTAIKATAQEMGGSKQAMIYFTYEGQTYVCPDTGAWARCPDTARFIKERNLVPEVL